jgi:hypothetical protein
MTQRAGGSTASPSQKLERIAHDAIDCVKKARKHRASLTGDNFYANKLATLRADATNIFRSISARSAGDTSAIAELIEVVFSSSSTRRERIAAYRDLFFNLRTAWQGSAKRPAEKEGFFPLSILAQAKKGYLLTVGRQMNGCFAAGWYDAAAVMMRRLIEIIIIEAFEGMNKAEKIKAPNGTYVQLTDLIGRALAEESWTLSRNSRKALPKLRDVGHLSAHGRYFTTRIEDLEPLQGDCRVVIEEFLHHAGLV